MKRTLILSMLCTLLCLTLSLRGVDAQESKVDMTKWITLTVKQGAEIKLDFSVFPYDVWVKVTGVEGEKEEKVTTHLAGKKGYKATGTTLIVYGAITEFYCSDNRENLTALDVSKNGNLEMLDCSYNQLSSLDVSKNGNLMRLYCPYNQLSSLDVSKNGNLTELNCYNNQLASLDVSKNGNLMRLNCSYNQLSSLEVSENVNLTELNCSYNQLSSLEVSENVNLDWLDCSSNRLSSLYVGYNLKLFGLYCHNNQLSWLGVWNNKELWYLSCHSNRLSSLDVSENGNLKQLDCSLNQLSSLDVSRNELLEKLCIYGNLFSTSTLNDLYCQLPDRTGKQEKGEIFPICSSEDIEVRLVQSSSKVAADAKNWKIKYYRYGAPAISGIVGNYSCGTPYALTLAPATLPHSLSYQGETWETMVTSTGEWKVDMATLPDWLTVSPMQGNSGTTVTVTAKPNTDSQVRNAALTFALINESTTKQVVVLRQNAERIYVGRVDGYTFPAAGESLTNYLTVESTGEWSVTSSAAWCTVEPKEGEAGTKQVTVKAEANSQKEAREAWLTFALKANANIKQVVMVMQKAHTISVVPSEDCVFSAAGETKSSYFTVESTQEWAVISSAAWCSVEPKGGEAGTKQVTVKAEANSQKEAREAELTFALKINAEIKRVVKVKQTGKGSNQNPSAVENVLFSGITVAPNPFGAQLVIKNGEGIDGRYELVNTSGVLVRSGSLQGRVVVLRTEGLKAGVYLLRILAGGGAKTFSVVKE